MENKALFGSKKQLAVELSRLKSFENPKSESEQYATDSEIAADLVWNAYMNGHIESKKVADLGCGGGILGIGALLMGAEYVYFIDADMDVLRVCKSNLSNYEELSSKTEVLHGKVRDFNKQIDTVIMNPPFGVKKKHADREFLDVAFSVSENIYSIHMAETAEFIVKYARDNDFEVLSALEHDFPLKRTMKYHTKNKKFIKVSVIHIEKKK